MIDAYEAEKSVGLKGKALGGVFSSLSRQKINEEKLVEPRGRVGRGLRWKLNEKIVNKKELLKVLKEILET